MYPILRHALLAGLCAGLVGCGTGLFRDRSSDYLQAKEIAPLQVPAHLDSASISQLLAIPPIRAAQPEPGTEFGVPRPHPLQLQASSERVELKESDDGRFWLWVEDRPESVWPQVRLFWEARRIELERANPRTGEMETGWLQTRRGDTRQRFRLALEPGLQTGSTEIHVLQVQRSPEQPEVAQWPARPDNPELARQLLAELALYLKETDPTVRSVSLLAQTLVRAEKSRLEDDNGRPVLRLELDFNRAWSAVGDALKRRLRQPGRQLEDIDRSQGLYYLLYVPDDELEPDFFDRLTGDREEALQRYRYQVRLSERNGRVEATVEQAQQPVAEPVARTILSMIKEALL